jgi:hypothetical protein
VDALIAHLLSAYNVPFAVALFLFLLLGVLQLAGFAMSSEPFSFMEDWAPDLDVDADPSGAASLFESVAAFLYFGRIPLIISVLWSLFSFSAIGYNLQLGLLMLGLGPLGPLWAALPALLLTLPVIAAGNRVMARLLPRDESTAVSEEALVGVSGEIVIGTVTHAASSEAKVRDHLGSVHYIQVVSENEGDRFERGDSVLTVRRLDHRYTVVADPTASRALGPKEG